jgi:hypothetical protein
MARRGVGVRAAAAVDNRVGRAQVIPGLYFYRGTTDLGDSC